MRAFSSAVSAPCRPRRQTGPRLEEAAPPLRFPEGTQDLSGEPGLVPITQVMTRPAVVLQPDMTVGQARALLDERGIHGAPVVDLEQRAIGMMSRGDLAAEPVDATLGDVMVCFAFTLPTRASLGQAAALMAYEGVHRVVVTDDVGQVVGVVSAIDVAAWVGEQAGYLGIGRTG